MKINSGKAAHSLLWSGVESGSLALISFGSLVVYSRLLTSSQFGLFSIVQALTDLLGVIATMLFHDALVQRPKVTDLHFDTAFTVTIALSLALAGACWGTAPLFHRSVGVEGAGAVLAWMSLMFPCLGLSATIVAQQRRQFEFKSLALRSLSGRVLGGGAGVAAALMGAGVWSLVIQQILTALVGSTVLWATAKQTPRLRFGVREFRELIGFGIFAVSGLFLSFSIKRLFTMAAGLILGVATAGYLNLAFRVVDVLWAILSSAVGQVSLPMLSGLQAEPLRLRRAYSRSVEFACLLLYPCFIGIAVTSAEIVEAVFGKSWAPTAPCISALACLVLLQTPRIFTTPVLTAVGRPRDALVGIGVELVFMLVVLATLGMPTLAWAVGIWVASECSQIPVSTWLLWRVTGYSIRDQLIAIRTPALAGAALALAIVAVRMVLPANLGVQLQLACFVMVGAIVYGASIILFDRRLVLSFVGFVRSGFGRSKFEPVTPGTKYADSR